MYIYICRVDWRVKILGKKGPLFVSR